MLMQEKIYDFRPSSVGDYSPVVVAAAVNLCRNTSSPRINHLNPYECSKYMPLYYSSKIFSEYSQLLAKPSSLLSSSSLSLSSLSSASSPTSTVPYLTMQLPVRTPSLAQNPSVDNVNASKPETNNSSFTTLPVKRTIDGSVKTNDTMPCENHRTQSVIMKVEDQRIVEIQTNELIARNANETDDEVICKWINCYRFVLT